MDLPRATRAIRELLSSLDEDPDREGLRATPVRAARAWEELTEGYHQDPKDVLKTTEGGNGFSAPDYDQMIVVAGVQFCSTCEHHLMPFMGTADVAYLPGPAGRVCGLSKIPRLVEVFARRLQIQEQMTAQIAHALQGELQPIGVGVRLTAKHLCASCRGVRKDTNMVTSILLGKFREPEVRAEFWKLAEHGGRP